MIATNAVSESEETETMVTSPGDVGHVTEQGGASEEDHGGEDLAYDEGTPVDFIERLKLLETLQCIPYEASTDHNQTENENDPLGGFGGFLDGVTGFLKNLKLSLPILGGLGIVIVVIVIFLVLK